MFSEYSQKYVYFADLIIAAAHKDLYFVKINKQYKKNQNKTQHAIAIN